MWVRDRPLLPETTYFNGSGFFHGTVYGGMHHITPERRSKPDPQQHGCGRLLYGFLNGNGKSSKP